MSTFYYRKLMYGVINFPCKSLLAIAFTMPAFPKYFAYNKKGISKFQNIFGSPHQACCAYKKPILFRKLHLPLSNFEDLKAQIWFSQHHYFQQQCFLGQKCCSQTCYFSLHGLLCWPLKPKTKGRRKNPLNATLNCTVLEFRNFSNLDCK